jgi:hypothetical protein
MAASPVLVDSSFYIARLRQGIDFTTELLVISEVRDLVTTDNAATTERRPPWRSLVSFDLRLHHRDRLA